eukprot:2446513-Prymnesium_polylepis.1
MARGPASQVLGGSPSEARKAAHPPRASQSSRAHLAASTISVWSAAAGLHCLYQSVPWHVLGATQH